MSVTRNRETKFVMNEYLKISVKRDLVQLCSDCYHALGWSVIKTSMGIDTVELELQRDRKIKHRVALCDLQRKCEDALRSIENLVRYKTTKAMAASIGVGLIGSTFLIGSIFAYLASLLPVCVILAIPALIGLGMPYFLYKKYRKESEEVTNAKIERYYDVIYQACEKANQLLQ